MFFLHTLIVHWAIQCPIITRCTALRCVLCNVYFLVFLQRTLGNAVQCCVVSIWILCAILVLLAALIWRQILLVVFVFRKKASRISGNYVLKNKWSDQRLWGLVTLIRGSIPIACFVFLLHWSCICHPGMVTKYSLWHGAWSWYMRVFLYLLYQLVFVTFKLYKFPGVLHLYLIGIAIVCICICPLFVFVRAHLGHGSQHLLLHLPNPAHKTWSSPCLFINVTFVFGDLNL